MLLSLLTIYKLIKVTETLSHRKSEAMNLTIEDKLIC
jgi:hypothetical protein